MGACFCESNGHDIRKARYLESNINQILGKAINVMEEIQIYFDAYLLNKEGNSDEINMGFVSYQYPYSRGKILF